MRAMEPAAAKPAALVVEDDDQISYILQFVLQQMGFEVHCAKNGEQAKALIAGMPAPAVATLDIKLPDASGVDLIILIKSTPGWERVPIIMVTGTPKDENVNWAIKSGAKGYIVKPFKPQELRDTVERLMARYRKA
jgi:DNA-binding response OmpR family regulator